jgi:hypothetical protein
MVDRAQTRVKDGIAWRIGSQADVGWMSDRTGDRRRITGAIPPVFADYATLVHPGEPDTPRDVRLERRQELALVEVLRRHAAQLPWWLGYLDTFSLSSRESRSTGATSMRGRQNQDE